MTESSAVLLWASVVDVWLPKQFPQRVFNRLKVRTGPPELLHLQDLTFLFFFLRLISLGKEVAWGCTGAVQESRILLAALCLSSPCATLEKWLCFCKAGHEKG